MPSSRSETDWSREWDCTLQEKRKMQFGILWKWSKSVCFWHKSLDIGRVRFSTNIKLVCLDLFRLTNSFFSELLYPSLLRRYHLNERFSSKVYWQGCSLMIMIMFLPSFWHSKWTISPTQSFMDNPLITDNISTKKFQQQQTEKEGRSHMVMLKNYAG